MLIILAAILAILVYGMIAAMLGTILPDLSKKFSLTPAQNGTIALAQAFGLILASLGVGPLIDNSGKKIALVLGLAIVTATLFALPRSRSYGNIALYLFALGLGGGIIVTGANALVFDIAPESRAATGNFLNLFFGLGGLATPFISANLLGGNSMRLCSLVSIVSLFALAVNAFAPVPKVTGGNSFDVAQVGQLLTQPTLWLLALFLFFYVSSEVGVWNWLAQHLIAQGIPEGKALNILSLGFALGLLLGRVAVAPVLNNLKVPPEQVTMAAAVMMAVTTFAMLRVRTSNAAWVAVFLAGISMAPVFPTTLAIVSGRFNNNATALGLAITFGWIGLAVSSRIIGSIAGGDPKRLRTALLVLPVFAVLMIGLNFSFL